MFLPDLFEDTKRGRNRRKTTAGPSTTGPFTLGLVPPTSGPLIPAWLDPPQASPERQVSPQWLQRGDRGGVKRGVGEGVRGCARGGVRGGVKEGVRGGKKAVTQEIVEEEKEEVRYSRIDRQIRPKKRWFSSSMLYSCYQWKNSIFYPHGAGMSYKFGAIRAFWWCAGFIGF